jgi:hypothetical protein
MVSRNSSSFARLRSKKAKTPRGKRSLLNAIAREWFPAADEGAENTLPAREVAESPPTRPPVQRDAAGESPSKDSPSERAVRAKRQSAQKELGVKLAQKPKVGTKKKQKTASNPSSDQESGDEGAPVVLGQQENEDEEEVVQERQVQPEVQAGTGGGGGKGAGGEGGSGGDVRGASGRRFGK